MLRDQEPIFRQMQDFGIYKNSPFHSVNKDNTTNRKYQRTKPLYLCFLKQLLKSLRGTAIFLKNLFVTLTTLLDILNNYLATPGKRV